MLGQRVAIHAAVRRSPPADWTPELFAAVAQLFADYPDDITEMSRRSLLDPFDRLPYGAVLGTAQLTDCWRVSGTPLTAINDDGLGDYSLGRWIWEFDNWEVFDEPVPAVGRQRLWQWTPPMVAA